MKSINDLIAEAQLNLNQELSTEFQNFAVKLKEELNREKDQFAVKMEEDYAGALEDYNVE